MFQTKGFSALLTIIILALLAGGGYWLWQGGKISQTSDNSIQEKFIYPIGGERLTIGQTITVKWNIPKEAYDFSLALIPVSNDGEYMGERVGGVLHPKFYLPQDTISYVWQVKAVYSALEYTHDPVNVTPGNYKFQVAYLVPNSSRNEGYELRKIETQTLTIIE